MKPGSPLSVKVLSRQGPPVSMGVWSLGSSPDKWTEILHQDKQNKMLRRCQPFELQAGTAIIDREFSRHNVDIASFQETRLAANVSLREKDYTFFWQGKLTHDPRLHEVGFAVKNSLLSTTEQPTNGSERILSLRLSTASGSVNLLSIYAPTLCSPPLFYENSTPSSTASPSLFLLGTSMPGSVTTMIHGLPALDTVALGK